MMDRVPLTTASVFFLSLSCVALLLVQVVVNAAADYDWGDEPEVDSTRVGVIIGAVFGSVFGCAIFLTLCLVGCQRGWWRHVCSVCSSSCCCDGGRHHQRPHMLQVAVRTAAAASGSIVSSSVQHAATEMPVYPQRYLRALLRTQQIQRTPTNPIVRQPHEGAEGLGPAPVYSVMFILLFCVVDTACYLRPETQRPLRRVEHRSVSLCMWWFPPPPIIESVVLRRLVRLRIVYSWVTRHQQVRHRRMRSYFTLAVTAHESRFPHYLSLLPTLPCMPLRCNHVLSMAGCTCTPNWWQPLGRPGQLALPLQLLHPTPRSPCRLS